MKKYFLTMAVMAIFAIGFAASDEEGSSSSNSTEQKQEKIDKMMKEAYAESKSTAMSYTYYQI